MKIKESLDIRRICVGDTVRLNFVVARIIDNEFTDEPCVLLRDCMGFIIENYTQEELDAAGAERLTEHESS